MLTATENLIIVNILRNVQKRTGGDQLRKVQIGLGRCTSATFKGMRSYKSSKEEANKHWYNWFNVLRVGNNGHSTVNVKSPKSPPTFIPKLNS